MPCRELRGAVVGRDEEVARLRRESEALLSAAAGGGPAPHLHVGFCAAAGVPILTECPSSTFRCCRMVSCHAARLGRLRSRPCDL